MARGRASCAELSRLGALSLVSGRQVVESTSETSDINLMSLIVVVVVGGGGGGGG